jgi:hypothetical protein
VLSKEDNSHPRDWSQWKKLSNIAVIASMASKSPVSYRGLDMRHVKLIYVREVVAGRAWIKEDTGKSL